MTELMLVPLKKIQPNPYQPRTSEDEAAIAEIAVNIFRNGMLQTPSARAVNGHYELVFGHTRKAAYELLATKGVPGADIAADKRFAEMPLYIHTLDDKQMFEMAVAENLKRRDLNSIETAVALQRYMNEFNVTSKQAGELFNLNEATVRGKVRLLDLPEQAQAKLASGEISEATARTLLSVQRVTSSQVVVDALKKIEKTAGNELPEETIENYLGRLKDNVITMWDEDRNDGKPRGDFRDSWLLDMKNFPNNLLPKLSADEAITALDAEGNKQAVSTIKGWVNIGASPEGLHKTPIAAELQKINPEYVSRLEHLLTPPACTACPFYTKVKSSHYCGNKVCHTRKAQAWHVSLIETASKKLKIDIYSTDDGKYEVLDYSRHRSMFEKRDKALRLISVSMTGTRYQWLDGVDDDIFVVCVVGDGIARLPKSSRGGSGSSGSAPRIEYAEIKARQLYKVKRQILLWEFTAIAKQLFDPCALPILEILNDWNSLSSEDQPPANAVVADNAKVDQAKGDYKRRLLIMKLVEHRGTNSEIYSLHKLVTVANRLAGHAERWGLKFPKELMKLAIDGDAEVDALFKALKAKKAAKQKAVAAATKAKK